MKKFIKTLLITTSIFALGACNQNTNSSQTVSNQEKHKISLIAPEGTPSLALANFYEDNKDSYTTFDIKSGSDPLLAAFTSASYDVIVAPTNLGAKLYNENKADYVLYQTIVWGNLYLVSSENISSFTDIENQELTIFGKNSTPDIITRSLLNHYNLSDKVTLNYVDDVATANAALKTGKAKYIISAQPSLSKINANNTYSVIDLQNEWAKISSSSSYPQASIFFKSSLKGQIDDILEELTLSVTNTINNPSLSAERATTINKTFETLGKETLQAAIPHCHYGIEENQKDAIEYYFSAMNSLGLSKQYGEKLPDQDFYYTI